MLEFLVRIFSVMTAAVFMLAMVFGVVSEFLGINFSDRIPSQEKNEVIIQKDLKSEKTLASDLTASLYQMDSMVKLENDKDEAFKEVKEKVKVEIKSIEDLEKMLIENKILVLLDNSVLSSFLYEEKAQVLTEVVKIHKDYVETTKGGMTFKGGSIYTHLDFLEAFEAAGSNFELLNL